MKKQIVMAGMLALAAVMPAWAASPVTGKNIRIDDNNAYPESLDTAHGALYISNTNKGTVYRALPGSRYAEPWLTPPPGYNAALGVVADAPGDTLWVCYVSDAEGKASLRSFNLATGAAKGVYDLPGGGVCNDIALKGGAAYVTETGHGRILKLAKGASQLSEWWQAPAADHSLNGIIFGPDGKLYVDASSSGHILRLDIKPDGSFAGATVLHTSTALGWPDGMRHSTDGKILLTEGHNLPGSANPWFGRVDEVTIHGDSADIRPIPGSYESPASAVTIGDTLYVVEGKFDYLHGAEMKGKDPGAFTIHAVSLP